MTTLTRMHLVLALPCMSWLSPWASNQASSTGGMIEHQQNQAMVKALEIPARRLILDWEVNDVLKESDVVITVDFHRPGANNILPDDCVPHIVIESPRL